MEKDFEISNIKWSKPLQDKSFWRRGNLNWFYQDFQSCVGGSQMDTENFNEIGNDGFSCPDYHVSKGHRKLAYSLAEIMVVFVIMTGIILMVGKIALGNRQKQYDAKFNKTSAVISSNISRDLLANTGAEFADYNAGNGGNAFYQKAVTDNLVENQQTCNNCWGNMKNDSIKLPNGNEYKKSDIDEWNKYELNDKTVIAVSNKNTDILIDANGKNGPNEFNKDIKVYDYPHKTCNHLGAELTSSNCVYKINENECKWGIDFCCNAPQVLAANKKSCECTNTNSSDHAVSSDSTVTWSLNNTTCEWSCNNSVNHSSDAKWLQEDDCDWKCSANTEAQGGNKLFDTNTIAQIGPTTTNGCKYTYPCKSGLKGERAVTGNGTSTQYTCACTNSTVHQGDAKWVHKNGATDNCSWECSANTEAQGGNKLFDANTIAQIGPTTDNGCEYKYPCKSGLKGEK